MENVKVTARRIWAEHQNHRVAQAGRDLGTSVVQPPAQSRVHPEIKPGCSVLVHSGLEGFPGQRQCLTVLKEKTFSLQPGGTSPLSMYDFSKYPDFSSC